MAKKVPTVYVGAHEIRAIFNENGFKERIRDRDVRAEYDDDGHPSPEHSGQPFCTRSQLISYYTDDDEFIVQIHRYLLSKGRGIGASGLPDPKVLFFQGQLYAIATREEFELMVDDDD